jgi:hypothetical protein
MNTMTLIELSHGQVSAIYTNLSENPLAGLHKSVQECLIDSKAVVKHLEECIRTNFRKYLHNKQIEMEAISNLTKKWHASRTQAIMFKNKLIEKKAYLFDGRLVDQWQLPADCMYTSKSLLSNRERAFKEMLPNESKEVDRHKDTYGYYSNKVKEEFRRVCDRSLNVYVEKFEEGIKDGSEQLGNVRV